MTTLIALLLAGCTSARIGRVVDAAVAPPFMGVVLVARDDHALFRKEYGFAETSTRRTSGG